MLKYNYFLTECQAQLPMYIPNVILFTARFDMFNSLNMLNAFRYKTSIIFLCLTKLLCSLYMLHCTYVLRYTIITMVRETSLVWGNTYLTCTCTSSVSLPTTWLSVRFVTTRTMYSQGWHLSRLK